MNTKTLERILVKCILILAYPIAIIEAHYNYFAKKTQKGYVGEVKYQHGLWTEYWGYV